MEHVEKITCRRVVVRKGSSLELTINAPLLGEKREEDKC